MGNRKPPVKTPMRPGKHGGSLRTGNPGNAGGGRPPNWLRDWCDDLLANQTAKEQVEAILKDKDHAAYSTMWKAVAERAHGRPTEHVEHSGTVNHKHQVWKLGDREVSF